MEPPLFKAPTLINSSAADASRGSRESVLCEISRLQKFANLLLLRKWPPEMELYVFQTGVHRGLAFEDYRGWKHRTYEKPLAIIATQVTERTTWPGHRAVSDTRARIDSLCVCGINIMRHPIYAIIGLRRIGAFPLAPPSSPFPPVNDRREREFALEPGSLSRSNRGPLDKRNPPFPWRVGEAGGEGEGAATLLPLVAR